MADKININIGAKTMESLPASDPQVTITVNEVSPPNQEVAVANVKNFTPVHLLDCDMDEHRNIVLHSFDIVNHLITGGTNPISMREYIVRDSEEAAQDGIAKIDLGYQLT